MAKVLGKLAGNALDMSRAARRKRARQMGFDPDEVYYHGTAKEGYVSDTDIKSFDPEKAGDRWSADEDGFFFTSDPDEAGYYARSDADYYDPGSGGGAVYPSRLKMENPLVIDADFLRRQGMSDIPTRGGNISFWDDNQGLIREWMEEAGADSVIIKEGDTGRKMAAVFDPSNIRSVNAAFDLAQKESGNLLAGIAPAAVGIGALSSGGDAQAAPVGMLDPNTENVIRAPQHPRLFDAVQAARGVGQRLEGSPASLLYPEATVNYLGRLAMGDKPTWLERAMVPLDWL